MQAARRDLLIGIGAAIIGAGFLFAVQDQRGVMTSDVIGGAWFPRATAGMIALFGIVLAIQSGISLRHAAKPSAQELEVAAADAPTRSHGQLVVAGTIALCALYVWALGWIGFLPATAMFLFCLQVLLASALDLDIRFLPITAVSVATPVVIYVLFTRVLGTILPEGTLIPSP